MLQGNWVPDYRIKLAALHRSQLVYKFLMRLGGINIDIEPAEDKTKCEICGVKFAKYVCAGCGREACSSCYWLQVGLCKKCTE
jgi:hypothetical protein